MNNNLLQLKKQLEYDKTFNCVQCGYCLPVCPTYQTMEKETHSPRGRINLVKLVAEGRADISVLEDPIDLCLGCRACEVACPTGVEYGKIYEAAKNTLEVRKKYAKPVQVSRKVLFKYVFPNSKQMRRIGNVLWFYQKSGIQRLARTSGMLNLLPSHLKDFEAVIPDDLSSPRMRKKTPKQIVPKQKKFKVAFFHGCIMDAMFQKINRLSIELLAKAGCEVVVLDGQTCCGALHAHSGEKELAIQLAKKNIMAFENGDIDFIVNNAGGCGAMLIEYGHLFHGDSEWEERAKNFTARTKDISQVLVECGGVPFTKEINEIVTYQPSCHMNHVQKVRVEPLRLLQSIPGIQFVEMENAESCCGSAGIYNLVHYKESMEILDEKMSYAKDTGATTIVTTNPGCLLQMRMGIEREGLKEKVRAVHLVELLAEAAGIN
ncbi:(Fe-S)-binding protein [Microaerobacter geothermalis]|uniref:(Fe-S)-binding protein n=1 Tax=Microaerobacter geothermalis TaxID=674972 RepID=UPI001F4737C3|nr:(Fe-S)-binding protein [Microaerobacter geothermalis]MCF6092659.1 (Fe-S)-binding protein [Microaerobacter geothermalis]